MTTALQHPRLGLINASDVVHPNKSTSTTIAHPGLWVHSQQWQLDLQIRVKLRLTFNKQVSSSLCNSYRVLRVDQFLLASQLLQTTFTVSKRNMEPVQPQSEQTSRFWKGSTRVSIMRRRKCISKTMNRKLVHIRIFISVCQQTKLQLRFSDLLIWNSQEVMHI